MTGSTAAEIYQVQSYYKRVNQKYNMTRQPQWNEEARQWNEERQKRLEELMARQTSGYRVEDWAFFQGANGNLANTGFQVNGSFRPGNYWLPLSSLRAAPNLFLEHKATMKRQGDPQSNSKLIAKMATLFGADQVGFCALDRRWVYSHYWNEETKKDYPIAFSDEPGYVGIEKPKRMEDNTLVIPESMKYCIVLIHGMDRLGMATAPTLIQLSTTMLAYSRISYSVVMLAEFIRGLGYNAIPSSNDLALSIPLAIDAGLGELGRNAKLINPVYGPCCRVSKVITDFPLAPGKPKLWNVTSFCNQCSKCADYCPAGAIPHGDRSFEPVNECNHNGVLQWQLDHKKCYQYWGKVGSACGICMRVCPFNKPNNGIHRAARWVVKDVPWLDPVLLWLDNKLNYGRYLKPSDYWGDCYPD